MGSLPLHMVLGPSEDAESGPAPRTGCVRAELLCQQQVDEAGTAVREATKGLGDTLKSSLQTLNGAGVGKEV